MPLPLTFEEKGIVKNILKDRLYKKMNYVILKYNEACTCNYIDIEGTLKILSLLNLEFKFRFLLLFYFSIKSDRSIEIHNSIHKINEIKKIFSSIGIDKKSLRMLLNDYRYLQKPLV
jgi:hypothetical protein